MESLSRPFHSRKLSNATSFSAKNAYADVFSGHRHKFAGASTIDVADYREIFGSSQANCSIPVLDVSSLSDASNLNLRHSKPDYSNIFGGFCDEQVGYYELFNRDKRESSLKVPTSPDSNNFSNQSPDTLKTYNMSYNKISPKSKDELNGTKHVTQLPATPGFIHFIDEPVLVSPPKMEAKNSKSSPVRVTVDSSKENTSIPKVKKSNTFDIDCDIDINRRRNAAINSKSNKTDTLESGPGGYSRTYFDDENINSDASASAAALKKAIEKAQESIRIAKESVGRKKKGLKSFSKKSKMEDVNVDTSAQAFADVRTNRKYGGTVNDQDGEKLFVAKKVIDEMIGKISASTKEVCNKFEDNDMIVSKPSQVMCETEFRPVDSAEKDECATSSSQTFNMFIDDYKEQESVERGNEVDEIVDVEYKDEVNVYELAEELNELSTSQNEKEDFHEFGQDDNEKRSDESEDDEVNLRDDFEIRQDDDQTAEIKDESVYNTLDHEYDEVSSRDKNVLEETDTVNLRGDCEIRQDDDDQTVEMNDESVDDTVDHEYDEVSSHDDNVVEEIDQVNLQNDCEIRQDDDVTGEMKQEYDEVSSCENNVVEETDCIDEIHVATNIVNTSDNMETNQEFDDVAVAGDFRESEVEEIELMKQADDFEVKLEENDTQSESSSGSIHDMKLEVEEESNEEKNIPEEYSTNEIKVSQKSPVLNETQKTAVLETGEVGPSKESEKESSRRVDEMTAKNNRLAVERAIREARERAFAEARERAERERAAVEKATEEVRRRMMADVIEKVVKNKSISSSAQSKLKAERAAVERATKEARQRALEKAISQKNVSDLNISESALRTKAKLEKHNRIMERAAKALAEKEKRDLLAEKEQAERNRLAENLDADIKRWSNGKEKNLRALLSTLQYILGPESGWKPITMTEIISSNAVKKAYRKATLCVHPDKLQQRGASIQHKYICEKVFDLLKAAWNRFNSEEK